MGIGGCTTGPSDRYTRPNDRTNAFGDNRNSQFDDNVGPLVRFNKLADNDTNGLAIRGGTLTTQSVWDDVDIVHVVGIGGEIVVPNVNVYGGLRLQAARPRVWSSSWSLAAAGFTASGAPLDINDRIGGSVQVIGTPGHSVVLTSLADDTVGAGFDPNGQPQFDTNGDGTGSSTTLPTIPDVPNGTVIDNNVRAGDTWTVCLRRSYRRRKRVSVDGWGRQQWRNQRTRRFTTVHE